MSSTMGYSHGRSNAFCASHIRLLPTSATSPSNDPPVAEQIPVHLLRDCWLLDLDSHDLIWIAKLRPQLGLMHLRHRRRRQRLVRELLKDVHGIDAQVRLEDADDFRVRHGRRLVEHMCKCLSVWFGQERRLQTCRQNFTLSREHDHAPIAWPSLRYMPWFVSMTQRSLLATRSCSFSIWSAFLGEKFTLSKG